MTDKYIVPNAVQDRCIPVDYSRQRLEGRLGRALDTNLNKGLMRINYEEYLDAYEEGAPALWPSGEYLGKFLHGLVKMARYTGDQRLHAQMEAIVNTWVEKQGDDGYLGTNPTGYLVGERWGAWGPFGSSHCLMPIPTGISVRSATSSMRAMSLDR